MQHPPFPRHPVHRNALARVAGAAGAAMLIVTLVACKGGETAAAAPAPTPVVAVAAAASPPPSAVLGVVAVPIVPGPDPAVLQAATQARASADGKLDAALAKASSCSADTECRSVAIGAKACGGPTGYKAYSSRGADPAAIESLAAQEREASASEARASGRVSPCFVRADPGARCEAHKCVTGGAGGRSGASVQ